MKTFIVVVLVVCMNLIANWGIRVAMADEVGHFDPYKYPQAQVPVPGAGGGVIYHCDGYSCQPTETY